MFRLRPTKTQRVELDRILGTCRELYNAGLQEKRDAYKRAGRSRSCAQQQAELTEIKALRPDVALVYSQVLQDVFKRLHHAFDGFFRRVKSRETPGYPRFKGAGQYDSFTFPQVGRKGVLRGYGVDLLPNGRLRVHGLPGAVKVIWHRTMLGRVKTATFKRKGRHWYVSFVCTDLPVEDRERTGRSVGIDLGLTSFATLDDGTTIANPRFARADQRATKLAARLVSKKSTRSKRRRKAAARLRDLYHRTARKRLNHHHNIARKLVREYDRIGVEDLQLANLMRGKLSKSFSDAGFGQFLRILISKAEGAGCEVVKVLAAGTTQDCSACGLTVPKDLTERVHRCACGFVADRDHNAALNVRARAFGTAPGSGVRRGAYDRAGEVAGRHASDDPRSLSL